ncbi:hypothetical protein [Colwellia sp. RSH04]|uniref:hypothetical protein n=1 Tax=Colwellia sp. RSH04 TaxID=2305464 RepID=UPI000E590726|nr:hypothetical protein [Colwellia sp. RSH04]RHW74891.1 hypothetical protein D1094_16585 [Colwellia sp. RSH04]
MKRTIILLTMMASAPILAQQNVYELKQAKAGKLTAIKSSQSINLLTEDTYDKYIISVSGDGGYSHQFESDSPSLSISDLSLPYNGSYNYEIKSVKYLSDVTSNMNNGRPEGATGKLSIVDVQAGQFTNHYGGIDIAQDIQEPREGTFPRPSKEIE